MTSAWDMLTPPREDAARREISKPGAEQPDRSEPGRSERINGAAAPRPVAGEPDPYLAPALRAAAAARAHSARIRAGQSQPPPPSLAERLAQEATELPGDLGPQSCQSSTESPMVTMVAGEPRGLSVAAAARASTIAFRPLRQTSVPLLQDADPVSEPVVTVPPAPPIATVAPGPPVAESGPAPRPAERVPRPAARPAESDPRPAPRRAEPQRRFAKTIAEVERYRAATQGDEPGAHVVPSPVLARPEQNDTAGGPWSRLWSRRKGPANG